MHVQTAGFINSIGLDTEKIKIPALPETLSCLLVILNGAL